MGVTANEILAEIEPLGSDSYKRVMFNHGVKEPLYGVKISDLQKIVKRIKKDYQCDLFIDYDFTDQFKDYEIVKDDDELVISKYYIPDSKGF